MLFILHRCGIYSICIQAELTLHWDQHISVDGNIFISLTVLHLTESWYDAAVIKQGTNNSGIINLVAACRLSVLSPWDQRRIRNIHMHSCRVRRCNFDLVKEEL
jgi:hypothetical protein